MSVSVTVLRDGAPVELDRIRAMPGALTAAGLTTHTMEWDAFVEEVCASHVKFDTLQVVGRDEWVPPRSPDGAVWEVVSSIDKR